MSRAIELLPPELKPFYEKYREQLLVRVTDPDEWRNVAWEDDPNHFVDFGAKEFGDYPFTALPREYGAAIEKFGTAALKRLGMLPWREAEEFGNLRRTFESFKGKPAYGAGQSGAVFGSGGALSFRMPISRFHATNNFDGQLTGNNGIHSRFERDLIERFESRLTITPMPSRDRQPARRVVRVPPGQL